MTPLETKRDGRNIHVLIQVSDGRQYVVLDRHFVRSGVNQAHLKWFERSPDRAAARAMAMVSKVIGPRDYEIHNARALTPIPNWFVVWFAPVTQFEDSVAHWHDNIVSVDQVENITARTQAAMARICFKAQLQHADRLSKLAA